MGRLTRRLREKVEPRFDIQIQKHIERHLGKIDMISCDTDSTLVPICTHIIAPTVDRAFYTLVTSGMSAYRMHRLCEHGHSNWSRAELVMYLPRDWPFEFTCGSPLPKRPEVYWPIRELGYLARVPMDKEWLAPGTTASASHGKLFPGTSFSAILILPTDEEKPAFQTLEIGRHAIDFFAVWPIYESELQFLFQHGPQALRDRLIDANVGQVVDIRRRTVA